MLVLCCGSRAWSQRPLVQQTLMRLQAVTGQRFKVLHGGASGADRVSGISADALGLGAEVMRPDWNKYGKRAGFIRNSEMLAGRPDFVVAFWDGSSRGTLDTISKAVNEYRIPTIIVRG
jgi:hypothetical protein